MGADIQKDDKKSGGGKGNSNTMCNFCHKKGHTEDNCWKKNLTKAPQWTQDKIKKEKSGSKTGGVEVVVASVEGQDFQQACC